MVMYDKVMDCFINNKYTRWYFKIIENARNSTLVGYTERHHVIPKSLGGSNMKENIVRLTAQQHFVCHLLLIRMTSGSEQVKMIYAARHMSICHRKELYKVTSITYERLKRQQAQVMKERDVSIETRQKISKSSTGKKRLFTAEHRQNLSKAKTGKKTGPQSIELIQRRAKSCQKSVQQFTLGGILIATYSSVKAAKLATGADVSRCCTGQLKSSKVYVWRYASATFITSSESSKHLVPTKVDDAKVNLHILMMDEVKLSKPVKPNKP
jgi:hypothetical protein